MNLPEININLLKLKAKRKKLKWGISGLGRFAERSVIPNLHSLRRSVLVSVYSRDIVRAKEIALKNGVLNYSNNFDEFLASDIDAVYIGSANAHHYEQVIKAAKAGKHILCDKPIAINSMQAEEMVRVCKENNVKLAVNYVYRFHPLILKAKELMEKEMLGKLVSINVNFNFDYAPNNNFRFIKEQSGGGALRDLGTHMIDLLRFLGGEVSGITGAIDNVIYKSEVDDFAAAIMAFNNGGYGYFNVSYNNKRAFNRIEILGHKGSISIENLIGSRLHPARLTLLFEGEAKKTFRQRGNKLLDLMKSVQNSFLTNTEPLVTGTDGLINMKIMEELERNAIKK